MLLKQIFIWYGKNGLLFLNEIVNFCNFFLLKKLLFFNLFVKVVLFIFSTRNYIPSPPITSMKSRLNIKKTTCTIPDVAWEKPSTSKHVSDSYIAIPVLKR